MSAVVSPRGSGPYQQAILKSASHRLTPTLVAAAAAAALALPSPAMAATCAPPGNSGVSQYTEVVPGGGCSHPSSGPGSGSGKGTGGHLPSSTATQLSKSGGAGKAVEQLVATSGTEPSSGPTKPGHAAGHHGAPAAGSVSASGRGPISALLHPILTGAGQGALGFVLPVVLACVLALMLAVALLRRRRLTQ